MKKNIIYNELVRQFQEGNSADDTINKKIDFLLVLASLFVGYFFTIDSFINIFIKGSVLVKHIFGIGILLLIISLYFIIKSFLLMRFKRGLKMNSVERIIKKYPNIEELSIINFSLKEAIKFNYQKQQKKNLYFFRGLLFLSLSIFGLIISKILFLM